MGLRGFPRYGLAGLPRKNPESFNPWVSDHTGLSVVHQLYCPLLGTSLPNRSTYPMSGFGPEAAARRRTLLWILTLVDRGAPGCTVFPMLTIRSAFPKSRQS